MLRRGCTPVELSVILAAVVMGMVVTVRVVVATTAIVHVIVPVLVVVVMTVAMMTVVMIMRRCRQSRGDLALDLGCLLARRALVLDRHRHDLGGQHDVVRPPEIMPPEPAPAIEQQ